ncbi:MAG TPA: SGNH/GDSL hydrolase family protein [Tepidisphaeraceae bacterium]|jgi:lysophospholipase L1-like esterase
MHFSRKLVVLSALLFPCSFVAAQAALQQGDRIAICGDSITEQKIYSVDMEDYLQMCKPRPDLRTNQFGWSGETTWGFAARIESDVLPFKPTVATTFYGMNDGGYSMLADDRAKQFHDATISIIEQFKKAGVRFIVVGSPGAVDTDTFKFFAQDVPNKAELYNKTLGQLGEMAESIAKQEGVTFVDVHDEMLKVMAAAKEKFGHSYVFAGGDGIHPGPNGHLVIAYCFLKGLGCDGNIGTIQFDAAAGSATASGGHKVVAATKNSIQMESTQYPFCFVGDDATRKSTTDLVQLFPFNEDLNRFTLIVKNAPAEKMSVSFGPSSKTFSKADLEKGINLAAEFLDNPFCGEFAKAEQAIQAQQAFETPAVKQLLHNTPQYRDLLPEQRDNFNQMVAATLKKDADLQAAVEAAITPVDYTIKIEPATEK